MHPMKLTEPLAPGHRGPLPSREGDAFRYWHERNAIPENELLKSLAMAQECIEQMHAKLTYADEAFPRVLLDPTNLNDFSR